MPINSIDGYVAAAKQTINYVKTGTRTTIATGWFSLFDLAGNPGAGVLAGTSTPAGVVPTDATAGSVPINAFGVGNIGYLSNVDFGSSVASRLRLFDLLFKAGAYSFNANQTLSAQPSFASRVPNLNYSDCQIWLETVTAFTGNLNVTVTYTNQDGVTGRSTGAFVPGLTPTLGRMFQLPLAAGDTGVRTIESVVSTTATAGTFNVLVLRPLWSGRVRLANDGDTHGPLQTGMPVVFDNSCLFLAVAADSTSSGVPELELTVANG